MTYRVALVVPSLPDGGGVPAVARFLCRTLEASDRYDPFLVSLAMSSKDEASVRIGAPRTWLRGVEVERGAWRGRPFVHVGARLAELEFMRYAPRRALTEILEEADLAQVVAGSPAWALPVAAGSPPVVLQVAATAVSERARRHRREAGPLAVWRWAMTRITDRLDREGLRRADRVVVENRRMERVAEEICGPGRVIFAPPGVDVNRFAPREEDRDPADDGYVLSVARFDDPRKNPELLVRAYARLVKRRPSAPPLWLAGKTSPPERAWEIAREHGVDDRIRYLGEVPDEELARLYRNALFFVLASDQEGFGLVLVEAMASGIPVVSTDCGGPGDIVTDGEDGVLVPVGDAEALADAMAELCDRPALRERLGRRARETAVSRYADDVAGRRFLRVYDDVLGLDAVRTPRRAAAGSSRGPDRS